MDGWITIGTRLDSSQLDKDLRAKQKDLQSYEKEATRLTTVKQKAEIDLQPYEEAKNQIKSATDETLQQAQTTEQVNFVLETEKAQLEDLDEQYKKPLATLEETKQKLKENEVAQSNVKEQIKGISTELEKQKNVSGIRGQIDSINNALGDTAKKVLRWSLALVGIRSVYNGIRQAVSIVSSQNQAVASNLQAMQNVIAAALLPIVQTVVRLMARLMVYVNYIFKAFTGKNLFDFSKATKGASDNLASGSKSLKKGEKSAKNIQKSLAGFDEMNILQDTGGAGGDTGGTGGAGVSTGLEGFDPSLFDIPEPKWLEWIVANKDLILSVLAGIAAGILAWKLGMDGIKALGFGLLIAGIVLTITSLLAYLKDPSWENFGGIIQGIGLAVLGVGIMIGSVPAIIVGAIVLIVGTLIKYWDQIKTFFQGIIDWLTGKSDWVHTYLGDVVGSTYDFIVEVLQNTLNWFDMLFTNIKLIFDGVIKFIKGVFTGDWKLAFQGLKDIAVGLFNIIANTVIFVFKNAFAFIKAVIKGIVGFFKGVINTIVDLFRGLGTKAGDVLAGAFKAVINGVLGAIESILNSPIKAINSLIKTINKVPGINIGKLNTFKLPRLAKGGIINLPGRGIPIGSAIAGERGKEGVIPLTDSQQMALLGESIGRYVTINATVINKMNGRVISKELQKVQNELDFAGNR